MFLEIFTLLAKILHCHWQWRHGQISPLYKSIASHLKNRRRKKHNLWISCMWFLFFSFKTSCASIVYPLNAYASFYYFRMYQIYGTLRNLCCSAIAMDCTLCWRNSPEYVLTYTFAYQLKIVLLDATPERNCLVLLTAWLGSVLSENSLTQIVFVVNLNKIWKGRKMLRSFFLTLLTIPAGHTFDTSLSIDLVLQVVAFIQITLELVF